MRVSLRSDAILQLGAQVVDQLEKVHHVDVLGAWMAHYVAESIHAAEIATGDDRDLKLKLCCEAILSIWDHRHRLPNDMRPFEELEPIFAALQSLDPGNHTPRYFYPARMAALEGELETEAAKWLQAVDSIDYTARILIRHCLGRAAESAIDKSKKWVDLAESAGVDTRFEAPVIRFIFPGENELLNDPDPDDAVREEIQGLIERLEAFEGFAATVASELKDQLKAIEPKRKSSAGTAGKRTRKGSKRE